MDKIIFTGRLGQDPEAKTSKDGKQYCRLNVAVTHFKPGGEKSTEWRNVTVFGRTSEYCIKYLKKGNMVAVEGFPSSRAYTPKNGGDPVGTIDVRAESVDAVGGGQGESTGGMTDVSESVQGELPF